MNIKKLSAAGIGLPLGVITVWLVNAFAGIDGGVPGEVGAAIGATLTYIASIIIPDDREE